MLALVGCGPSAAEPPAESEGEESGSTGSTAPGSTAPASTEAPTTGAPTGGPSTSDGTSTAAADESTAGPDQGTGAPVCVPMCDNSADCNDGIDNDDDGLVDAEDIDCISPCHNYEDSAYHGVRFGQGGCKEECYFDGNTGMGDDGCSHDMRCDPLGPKDWFGCEPDPDSNQCQLEMQYPECLAACLPMVPPGCDCFGCCVLPTPGGLEARFLGHPDCTLTDPVDCPPCTQNTECINPCDDPCEWCLGEPEPPAGCPEVTCDAGPPCTSHCDCADGFACLQGCCRAVVVMP